MLDHFAGVSHREIVLRPEGITVVQGPNESGKSTLLTALDLLLTAKDSSTAAPVRRVKPEGRDVGPSVLAEFTTGAYRVAYAKQWLKGQRTEAEVSGPKGTQRLTGAQAHDQVAAILRQTMDLPLWDALRVHQGLLAQGDTLPKSSALQHALDAASAGGVGGAQEAALLERVRIERDQYFTPRAGRPTGGYLDALATRDRLQAKREQLAHDLRGVQQLIDSIPVLAAEIATLEQKAAVAADLLGEAQAQMAALREEAAGVDRMREHAATVRERSTAAAAKLAQRNQSVAAINRAAWRVAAAEARRQELNDIAVLQQEIATKESVVSEAQAAAAAERRAAAAAQQDMDHLHRVRTAADLHGRLRAAQAAADAVDACRKKLDGIRVTAELLKRLQEAQRKYERLHAQEQVQLPALVVTAHTDLDLTAGGQTVRVPANTAASFAITGQLDLDVPGALRLTVTGGTAVEEVRRKTLDARQALADLLAEAGAPHVEAAHQQLADRNATIAECTRAAQALAGALSDRGLGDLLREATAAADEVARYVARRDHPAPLPETLEDAEAARSAAISHEEKARGDLAAAQDSLAAARARLAEAVAEHGALEREARAAGDDLRDATQRLVDERAGQDDASLEAEARECARAATEAASAFAAVEAAHKEKDPEAAAQLLAARESGLEGLRKRLEQVSRELAGKQAVLEARQSDGLQEQLEDVSAESDMAVRTAERLAQSADAARLLYETMERHRALAFQRHHAPYRRAVEHLGRIVFGRDFGVELSDDLILTHRTMNGITLEFDQLSTGAQEQLAILARLAAAQLVSSEGVPVILDDSFGYSDPSRLDSLGAVLHTVGQTCQIILLTCSPTRYAMVGDCAVIRLDDTPLAELTAFEREAAATRHRQHP